MQVLKMGFISTDNGATWKAINSGLTNLNVLSVVENGSNIYAGTTEGGVFQSKDKGATWKAMNTGLANSSIFSEAVNGSNTYAGNHDVRFI